METQLQTPSANDGWGWILAIHCQAKVQKIIESRCTCNLWCQEEEEEEGTTHPRSPSPSNCGSLTSESLLSSHPLWEHEQALCLLSESAGRRHFKPHHSKANMLKPAVMQTVNKSDCRPRLDGSEATLCHPALTFALWEVHAEAATALRLSQTSHLQERNCWKGSRMGMRRKRRVWLEDDQQWKTSRERKQYAQLWTHCFCSTGCQFDTGTNCAACTVPRVWTTVRC